MIYTVTYHDGDRMLRADLVFSADDGGWYLERWTDSYISQLFDTESEALAALYDGKVEWYEAY